MIYFLLSKVPIELVSVNDLFCVVDQRLDPGETQQTHAPEQKQDKPEPDPDLFADRHVFPFHCKRSLSILRLLDLLDGLPGGTFRGIRSGVSIAVMRKKLHRSGK
jgi:hypothetical protein